MADYTFYLGEYMGDSIPAEEFPRVVARAEAQLKRYKRIYAVSSPDKNGEDMAICAMADALYYFESVQNGSVGGQISSVSIGSVSVGYGGTIGGSVDMSAKGQAAELYRCACLYLDIHRGCGRC